MHLIAINSSLYLYDYFKCYETRPAMENNTDLAVFNGPRELSLEIDTDFELAYMRVVRKLADQTKEEKNF